MQQLPAAKTTRTGARGRKGAIVVAAPTVPAPARQPGRAVVKSVQPSRVLALVPPASLSTELKASFETIEGEAAEYQHWCDAMVSSITWIAEAIEEHDLEGLEKALGYLEAGVAISAPALVKMATLAAEIRKRMPREG